MHFNKDRFIGRFCMDFALAELWANIPQYCPHARLVRGYSLLYIFHFCFDIGQHRFMALLNIMFVGCVVEQNAVIQQYMNSEVDDILHFEDHVEFSLNAADGFSSIIHAVQLN